MKPSVLSRAFRGKVNTEEQTLERLASKLGMALPAISVAGRPVVPRRRDDAPVGGTADVAEKVGWIVGRLIGDVADKDPVQAAHMIVDVIARLDRRHGPEIRSLTDYLRALLETKGIKKVPEPVEGARAAGGSEGSEGGGTTGAAE